MAPEILNQCEQGYPVDFYALGVIGYELLLNKRPVDSCNKNIEQMTT